MSYIVGAFAVAALVVAALVFPTFRLAGGIVLIITGLVTTMFAIFFGPVIIALGVLALIAELWIEREPAGDQPPTVPRA